MNSATAISPRPGLKYTARENTPVNNKPAPTTLIDPIATKRLTTSEPTKIPNADTNSNSE